MDITNGSMRETPADDSYVDVIILVVKFFSTYHILFLIFSLVLVRIDEGEFNETFAFVVFYDVGYLFVGFFLDILLCGATLIFLFKKSSPSKTLFILLFGTILVLNIGFLQITGQIVTFSIFLFPTYEAKEALVIHLLVAVSFLLARVIVFKKARA